MRIIHFDANGWRARHDEGFDKQGVARVADALGLMWGVSGEGATVYVGYDARPRSCEYAQVMAAVMASFGLDVRLSASCVPTPAVAHAAAVDDGAAGAVIITAPEDPGEWGGVLLRGPDGGPMPSAFLGELERLVPAEPPRLHASFGHADLTTPYIEALLSAIDCQALAHVSTLVVADALNGAGAGVLEEALTSAGAEVTAVRVTSGTTPCGLVPEPGEPQGVAYRQADGFRQVMPPAGVACGVVLDGGGERATLVDECGRLVSPHIYVPLLLGHLVTDCGRRGRVVATMASSALLRRQAARLGLEHTSVPVGFERAYGEMLEGDVLLAADEYGGVCLPTHLRERDGLLASMLAVEMVVASGRTLSELVAAFEADVGHMEYGRRDMRLDAAQIQALRNVLPGLNPAQVGGRSAVEVSHADGLRLRFGDDSWAMLRPARTQPVVRAYAEAPTAREREELLDGICELARKHG